MTKQLVENRQKKHLKKYATIGQLLDSPPPSLGNSLGRLYDKMIKSLAAFNLYKIQGNREQSLKLALDLYKTASKYHAPKYLHEVSDYLFLYYSTFEFDRKKALKYANSKNEALEAYALECKLSGFRSRVILEERSPHSKKNAVKNFELLWKSIEPMIEKVQSWEFNRTAYVFGCQYYYKIGDRKKLLIIAENAINYLEQFPLQSNSTLAILYKYKLISLTLENHDSKYEIFIDKYGKLVKKGSTAWFNYKYSICQLRLYQMDHSSINSILSEVTKSIHFKAMPDANRASWHILIAYQNFHESIDPMIKSPRRFKIAKLINQSQGNHFQSRAEQVQLQIIQILFHLLDKNISAVEKRTSAIEKYITRIGLRLKDRRTYIFIKMLVSIPENQYHFAAIERHSQKFYNKLKNLDRDQSIHFERIEIFPYERLWEMIMENLKK